VPGLATLPDSLLVGISTPHRCARWLFEKWRDHYGRDGDLLVIRASSAAKMKSSMSTAPPLKPSSSNHRHRFPRPDAVAVDRNHYGAPHNRPLRAILRPRLAPHQGRALRVLCNDRSRSG